MVPANGPGSRAAEQTWQVVDAFVRRFEEAWRNGGRPTIDAFLPKAGPADVRRAVLIELIEVDLEQRLHASEPARREEYVERYPELAACLTAIVESPRQHQTSAASTALPQQIG